MKRLLMTGLCCLALAGASHAKESPNFVIIYTDDLGWADTSVSMMKGEPLSKSDFYQTPALERLADQGMVFSNGYSPTPTCTGSRISIQFGQTSARLQYRNVFDVLSKTQRGQEGWNDEVSIAGVLKAANKDYVTAHFGKGMSVRRMDHAGYDVTDEFDKGVNGNAHGSYIDTNKRIPIPDDNPKRISDLTRRSVGFVLENAGKRPFYLMVSHYAVHIPHQASPQAIERCRRRWVDAGNPDVDMSEPGFERDGTYREWVYAAMVEETDESLGAILDALEDSNVLDNTFVIFTSDNGGGHSRRDEEGNRFNGPLQEGKRSMFEGGLRIPFVVSGPGIEPGSQCDVPVVQWDLLPTLHDYSGSRSPLPSGVDGGSLREVFERGNAGSVNRSAPGLVFHYPCHYHPPISVIRVGNYKLMRHLNSGELRLYDMTTDYVEQNDLAASMPEKVEELDRIRQRYVDEVDGGSMSDVYAAYFEWLNESLHKKEELLQRNLDSLKQDGSSDSKELRAQLEADWQTAKRSHEVKTAICKDQMKNHSWRESNKNEVIQRVGVDKSGFPIEPPK